MHISGVTLRSVLAIAALALTGSAFAAGQDGQTVFKDPVTGKVRNPTAQEAKALNDLRAADRAARKAERKAAGEPEAGVLFMQPNGIGAVVVGEELVSYSVVRRNADGKLEADCIQGKSAAEAALNNTTTVTKPSEEHQHEVQ